MSGQRRSNLSFPLESGMGSIEIEVKRGELSFRATDNSADFFEFNRNEAIQIRDYLNKKYPVRIKRRARR